MTLTANQHKAVAIVLFLSLIVFLRLGSGEIQPNEEGLNAMSSKSIIENNNNTSHTENPNSDKYSTPVTPLLIWAISGSMSVFGESNFSIRLFTALCSALALGFFYLISRRFLTYSSSIIAIFILSGTMAWNNYSRQGITDVPAIAFILASLFLILKTYEAVERKQILLFSFLFGLSFLSTIFTKPGIFIFPLLFVFLSYLKKEKIKRIHSLLLASGLTIIFSIIIYIIIPFKSGINIFQSLFPFMSIFDINNYSNINQLDVLNLLIIYNPFIIFAFIYILIGIKKINKLSANSEHGKYINYILCFWFLFILILLTNTLTIHKNIIVYLLPPAILIALKLFDNLHLIIKSNRTNWIILTSMIAFFLWSFIFNLRSEVELLFIGQNSIYGILYIIIILVFVSGAFLLPKKILDKLTAPGLYYTITIIPYLMILKVILFNLTSPVGESFGALRTADILNSSDNNSFVYLYHEDKTSDSLNIQLDWYSKGWLSGKISNKTYIPVKQSKDYVDYKNLRMIEDYPEQFIVYYSHRNISVKTAVMKELIITRSIISRNSNYIIFGRKNSERSPDKPI